MLNKASIIGHLGADVETRYLPSGDAVASFRIATTERFKDKATGEQREQTEWHSISAFGKLAEICSQYLHKGSLVYVEGRINTRKYTDKDGVERYATGIKADTMKMLGGKGESAPAQRQAASQRQQAPAVAQSNGFDDMDSDIPF